MLKELAGTFSSALIRRQVQRKIAMGLDYRGQWVAGLAEVLGAFTPQGLQLFIQEGNSLVELWLKDIPPAVWSKGLLDLRGDKDAAQIARDIDWGHVLDIVAQTHPAQAEVVRNHRGWYATQGEKALETFLGCSDGTTGS